MPAPLHSQNSTVKPALFDAYPKCSTLKPFRCQDGCPTEEVELDRGKQFGDSSILTCHLNYRVQSDSELPKLDLLMQMTFLDENIGSASFDTNLCYLHESDALGILCICAIYHLNNRLGLMLEDNNNPR